MRYHQMLMRMPLAGALFLAVTVQAFSLELTPDELTDAIALGQTGIESRRTDFHRPYRLIVDRPPVDYIDVITPFRRVVLAAEARLLSGERLFGQRDAVAVLGDQPTQVDLRLELTFHPLNTFIGVPSYEVGLVSLRDSKVLQPRGIERIPRFGPRLSGQAQTSSAQVAGLTGRGQTQPLLGGVIIASFDGRLLDAAGRYEIVVAQEGTTLATVTVDFSKLR